MHISAYGGNDKAQGNELRHACMQHSHHDELKTAVYRETTAFRQAASFCGCWVGSCVRVSQSMLISAAKVGIHGEINMRTGELDVRSQK